MALAKYAKAPALAAALICVCGCAKLTDDNGVLQPKPENPQTPAFALSADTLRMSSLGGSAAARTTIRVWNSGSGTLSFTVSTESQGGWLSCDSQAGHSAGDHDSVVLTLTSVTQGLAAADSLLVGQVILTAQNLSVVTVPVVLSVLALRPGMSLVRAAGCAFQMGRDTVGVDADEKPVHEVRFTHDFWMDSTEVTQKQYRDVMTAAYPGYSRPNWTIGVGIGDDLPAYNVDWFDAALYCNARSRQAGLDTVYNYTGITGQPGNCSSLQGLAINQGARGFRLPTEAEWEYACRAGSAGKYFWGDSADQSTDFAWGVGILKPVAGKRPNPWGLYDIYCNVIEWCNDWYLDSYYSSSPSIDPPGPETGTQRVMRGGSYMDASEFAPSIRSSNRVPREPAACADDDIGFRTVLPLILH